LKPVHHVAASNADTIGAFNTGLDTDNQSLKAVHHIVASSADTMGAFNMGIDRVNLHRLTLILSSLAAPFLATGLELFVITLVKQRKLNLKAKL
jgi:hypothetical protein